MAKRGQLTPDEQIREHLITQIEKRKKVIIRNLIYLGFECVIESRNNGDYEDQTGNLRSSIGFAVISDGKIVHSSNFEKVKNGEEGSVKGVEFLNKLIREHNRGIVLIMVAGMNYATYVETKRNVISSSEIYAKRKVPLIMKQLGFKK